MVKRKRVNLIDELSKLSPMDKVYEELEKDKNSENLIGFIPIDDSTDTPYHIINLASVLSALEKNVLLVDADVFYPSMYKIIDCPLFEKGKGLLEIIKDDRRDIRECLKKTKMDNVYLVSSSPEDNMEEFFEVEERDIERMLLKFKEVFDIILVYIPNNPPLEFCYATISHLSLGFLMWSPRVACPMNTRRLLYFLNSIGISTQKLGNVLLANAHSRPFDMGLIKEMGLRFIAELPHVEAVADLALRGEIYMKDSAILDKRYKLAIEKIGDLIIR